MTKYRVGPDVDLATEDVRDSKGHRITEEYAERAAGDALASVGRGRPSLTGAKEPSPQVTFRVTPELRAKVNAERSGRASRSPRSLERPLSGTSGQITGQKGRIRCRGRRGSPRIVGLRSRSTEVGFAPKG